MQKRHLFVILIMCILTTTVAYSGLSTSLAITSEATFRPNADIRITNIELESAKNNALEQYKSKYTKNTTTVGIKLPNTTSEITYKVTVENRGDIDQTIYEILTQSTNNSNVKYELENYKEKKTFLITFKNESPTEEIINIVLKYDFRKVYKVEYDSNGGEKAPESQNKYEKEDLKITEEEAVKEGNIFKGWTDEKEGKTVKYEKGSTYTLDKNILLYAVWEKGIYENTISHWAGGFKNKEGNNNTTTKTAYKLNITNFKQEYKTTYKMDETKKIEIPNGYSLHSNFGTSSIDGSWKNYTLGTEVVQKGSTMHYEYYYYPIDYNITYNLNGGINNSENPKTYNVLYGVTFKNPSKKGYTFEGWADESKNVITGINEGENATFISASDLYSKLKTRTTGDKTLTAQWTPNTYEVTLDSQGATSAGTTKYYYQYNTGKTIDGVQTYYYKDSSLSEPLLTNITVPTKTGYTFKGYYTEKEGKGTQYVNETGGRVNNLYQKSANNITLYAYWIANEYTLSYDFDSGNDFGYWNKTYSYRFNITYDKSSKLNNVSVAGASGWEIIYVPFTTVKGEEYTFSFDYQAPKAYNTYSTYQGVGYQILTSVSQNDNSSNSIKTGYIPKTAQTTTKNLSLTFTATSEKTYIAFNFGMAADGETTTLKLGNIKLSKKIKYDSLIGTTPQVNLVGNTFSGWYTALSGGTKITSSTKYMTAANQTIYAIFTPNTYEVTLDSQGATSEGMTKYYYQYNTGKTINGVQTYYYKDSGLSEPLLTNITIPTKTGYTFKGYYTEKEGKGTQYVSETGGRVNNLYQNNASNITLYAYWIANEYTITYNLNDGIGNEGIGKITYDSTYGTLPTPTRTGYTFDGWYTASSGGTKITSSTKYTTASDQTIYAHWIANTYTVSYNANGGSGTMSSDTAIYDSNFITKKNAFTRTGYTFNGWNEKADGTGSNWTSWIGKPWKWAYTKNITLYAQWTANTYTVSYNANGGTGTMSSDTAIYDSNFITKKNAFTRTGYTFNGWNEKADGTGSNWTSWIGKPWKWAYTKNITLYAQWTANKIKLTLNGNGGTLGTSAVWYYYGTSKFYSNEACTSQITKITLPTRTGYTYSMFTGDGTSGGNKGERYTNADGSFTGDLATDIYKNATLTAQWTANTYTVSYNANGGSVSPSSTTVTYNSTYGTLATPTRTDYRFDGWYTAASGGTKITSSTKVTITANQTIYAHWTQYTAKNVTGSTTNYYTSLNSALNAASTTAATTTTLIKNTSETINITVALKNTTLNLNGKTLTGVFINNNTSSNVTIYNGTITNSKDRVIYNAGVMNITSGTYTGSYSGYAEKIYNVKSGTMNISGGTFINNVNSIDSQTIYNAGTMNVTGGTIQTGTGWTVRNSGTFKMSGGTIKLTTNGSTGTALYNDVGGVVTTTGGTIESAAYGFVNNSTLGISDDSKKSTLSKTTISITYSKGYHNVLNRANSYTLLQDNTIKTSSTTGALLSNESGRLISWNDSLMNERPIIGEVYRYWHPSQGRVQFAVFGRSDITSFPTWTSNNGQDDIKWYAAQSYTSTMGTYKYVDIYTSNHNNESGEYLTHIYASSTFVYGFSYTMP